MLYSFMVLCDKKINLNFNGQFVFLFCFFLDSEKKFPFPKSKCNNFFKSLKFEDCLTSIICSWDVSVLTILINRVFCDRLPITYLLSFHQGHPKLLAHLESG